MLICPREQSGSDFYDAHGDTVQEFVGVIRAHAEARKSATDGRALCSVASPGVSSAAALPDVSVISLSVTGSR